MNAQFRLSLLLLVAVLGLGLGNSSAALLTWWKLDEAAGSTTAADSSGNANIGTLTNFDFTADSDFDPAGGKHGGAIHFDGANDFINNTTGFQPAGNFTYSYFFKPDEVDYTVGHGRDDHIYCNARPHFSFSRDGGGDGQLGMYLNVGGDTQVKTTTNNWLNTEWYHIAWTFDGAEVKVYVDGTLESTLARPGTHTVQGDGRFNLGSNAGGSGTATDAWFDDLAIWDEALTAADVAFIAANGVEALVAVQGSDTDNDKLPDVFEQLIIDSDPNDGVATVADVLPNGDFDNDESTNEEEFNRGTDPTNPDSDGDGLNDGPETNTGIFVDVDDTGSDPLKADSDGDTISDGDEVNATGGFATDPNKKDTDGDGVGDKVELDAGTDPTDPASKPAQTTKILFIGGQVGPTQGADAAVMTYLEERYGAGNVTYKQASQTAAGEENDFDALIISSTPGSGSMRNKFHNSTTPALNWEEATADSGGGEYGMSSVVMTKSQTMTRLDLIEHPITAGLASTIDFCTSGETTNTTGLFAGLTSVANAANGTGSAGPGNGQDIVGNPAVFIADLGDSVNPSSGITGGIAPSRRVMFPMTDATFNNLTDDGKTLFGQAIDWILGIAGADNRLKITDLSADPNTGMLSLSWESRAGKLYDILSSVDPENEPDPAAWTPLVRDIVATAPENTSAFAMPADPTRLFVVQEREAPPFFVEDFESGQGDWTVGVNDGNGNTAWEFGTPAGSSTGTGPTSGADGSTNCFTTNFGDYGTDSDVVLRSPAIDLTGAGITNATLSIEQWRDADGFADTGAINIVLAGDPNTVLGTIDPDLVAVDNDWQTFRADFPAAAIGESVLVEFQFTSDASVDGFSGWSIDNVEIEIE